MPTWTYVPLLCAAGACAHHPAAVVGTYTARDVHSAFSLVLAADHTYTSSSTPCTAIGSYRSLPPEHPACAPAVGTWAQVDGLLVFQRGEATWREAPVAWNDALYLVPEREWWEWCRDGRFVGSSVNRGAWMRPYSGPAYAPADASWCALAVLPAG